MLSIAHDGTLLQEEALGALQQAAQAATEALPFALARCESEDESFKVMNDRDTVLLAYLEALRKSLVNNGAMFENIAIGLRAEADAVRERKEHLANAAQAIALMGDLVKLATSLALAFA